MSPYPGYRAVFDHLKRSKTSMIGLGLILLVLLLAIFAPSIAPFGLSEEDLRNASHPPDMRYLFGTDELGRDVFSRVLYGARISLLVGFVATFLSVFIGLSLGLVSGYLMGRVDDFIMRLVDVTMAFPSLLLAIGISCALGRGLLALFVALSFVGWAGFARITRGLVLSIKEEPFIEAARSLGSSNPRILFTHILPHTISMVVVLGAMRISTFILTEAGLSFLGLGLAPPTPTWGGMVSQGGDYIGVAPWMGLFPGGAIALTVVGFNLLGDGLRDLVSQRVSQVL